MIRNLAAEPSRCELGHGCHDEKMAELNGRPVELGVFRALALINYGHFTTFRVDEGRVRGLSLHLDRLERDCRALFSVDLDIERVRELVRRALPEGSTTLRVTLFDPAMDLGHPNAANDPQVLITRRAASAAASTPLRVRSTSYVREAPEVKSVGLFGPVLHRRLAQQRGFDDALFVDRDQRISEGGTWNVGFFDGDHVIWPQAENLPGVTMRLLQDSQQHRVAPVRVAELASMQAAFATNANIGVRAIAEIDGIRMRPDHPVLDMLGKQYLEVPGEVI